MCWYGAIVLLHVPQLTHQEALTLLGCIVFLNVKRDLCLQRQVITYMLL